MQTVNKQSTSALVGLGASFRCPCTICRPPTPTSQEPVKPSRTLLLGLRGCEKALEECDV